MTSWLFGGNKKAPVQPTNLQALKTKQIGSLSKLNAVLTEVIRDTKYNATFPVNSTNITLVINLPLQFPQTKPTITVEPAIRHPWVDNNMSLSLCPALIGFSMHSCLGSAIQTIIDEFRVNPPQRIVGGLPTLTNTYIPQPQFGTSSHLPVFPAPSFTSAASTSHHNSICSTVSDRIPYFYTMPPLPSSFNLLSDKTATQLNVLLNDDETFDGLLEILPEIKKIADDKDAVSKKCANLSKENLSIKPLLQNRQEELRTNIKRLGSLQNSLDAAKVEYTHLCQQYNLSNVHTNLKVAILEAEEESDHLAESYLENIIQTDDFCKAFLPKRALCHSRRVKEEKLLQIMSSEGYRF